MANPFENVKWAEWMEDCLKHMINDNVEKVMIVAVNKNGQIATANSPDVSTNDLALAGFWLTQEAIRGSIEDEEDEEEEE